MLMQITDLKTHPAVFRRALSIAALWIGLAASDAIAEVRLPGFFGDHMVLQQGIPIKVWGWADPGEKISVQLGEQTAETQTDAVGKWNVTLPALEAGNQPHKLVVSGTNSIELDDVLIGEVWLCSGQSNMEWSVNRSRDAEQEKADANFPLIRHLKVQRRVASQPEGDISSLWRVCSPATAGDFTAVGYFMARKLHRELGIPIGLINSSWGGTRIEPWTAPVGFQKVDALQQIYESVIGRTPGSDTYNAKLAQHIVAIEKWVAQAKVALGSNEALDESPAYPDELAPFKSHQDPTTLYNGMIHALVGFPIRGAIWYQGESNHNEGMLYVDKKEALINGWRELWGQGEFPFYFVQIAPYQYGNEDPTILPRFWEAQAAVTKLPNTAMVVINDIATLNDIHPPNKQDVGSRLADVALANDYGQTDRTAKSPQFDSLLVQDGGLVLTFKHTAGGLRTRNGESASHFEVIGSGAVGYRPAVAKIDGDTIRLTSDEIQSPVAFRFAWHKVAQPNLIGGTGLPVGACRGGKIPDFFDLVPNSDQYQLVYDIDLSKLGKTIRYDVNKTSTIGAFDRIGYLVELDSFEQGPQSVFVSMSAFTDDASKIAIPTFDSNAIFRQSVKSMRVFSSVDQLNTGDIEVEGSIEFWPHNYGPANGAAVPAASSRIFDFGDTPSPPQDGYGSMQVHHPQARKTIFAINHWSQGAGADIGIGNSTGDSRDWTFSQNASKLNRKRLRVFVRPK